MVPSEAGEVDACWRDLPCASQGSPLGGFSSHIEQEDALRHFSRWHGPCILACVSSMVANFELGTHMYNVTNGSSVVEQLCITVYTCVHVDEKGLSVDLLSSGTKPC